MNESMIKLASRFIPGKKKRREFKEKHLQKLHAEQAGAYKKMKLIMTLVCKDEIDIIEKHLLFHHHHMQHILVQMLSCVLQYGYQMLL